MRRESRGIIGLAALLIAALGALAQAGTVELRSLARVEPGRDVTLADVARLTGEDAQDLGEIVLIGRDDPALSRGRASVAIERVRALIDARGVNWGMLTLRGGRCDVLVREARTKPAPEVQTPQRTEESPSSGAATVRTFVERRLRETFGVDDPGDMRIRFDDRDEDLLSMTLDGRLVDAHTTGSSSRVPVSVSVYEGERLLERRQIRAEVMIRRQVCVLREPARRGERIDASMFTLETRWMATDTSPLTPEEAAASEIKSPVDAGVVLERKHVEAPVVVRRGGLVVVHYLSGPVILKTRARALSDGRMGDRIQFEALGTKRRFMARVDGADRAVVRREGGPPGLLGDEKKVDVASAPVGVTRNGIAVTRAE